MIKLRYFGLSLIFVLLSVNNLLAQSDSQNSLESDDLIYDIVEREPVYPGGDAQIARDVGKNFKYPKEAIENNITGTVVVRFVVEKDGSISNVVAVRGPGHGINKAAVKAVEELPKFESPASQNGIAVRYYYSIPIVCKLDSDSQPKKKRRARRK